MVVSDGRIIELNLDGVEGWLVIDTFIMGRCWGGIRISPYVTVSETKLLARAITLKSALAGIPIGGAKIGIKAEPSDIKRLKIIEKLATNIRKLVYARRYTPGTDIGFSEENLKQLYAHIGLRPTHTLHKMSENLSLTGLAVAESLHAAIQETVNLFGMHDCETVAIQGFGNMGSAAAYVLSRRGYRIVAVGDRYYTLVDREGINIDDLLEQKKTFGEDCLREYSRKNPNSKIYPPQEFLNLESDIHVPGAGILSIVKKPNCRIIAPIANYPVSIQFAKNLEQHGIKTIPDIISNAGGAIGSALSILQRKFDADTRIIAQLTRNNLKQTVLDASKKGITPIEEAYARAWRRLKRLRMLGPLGLPGYLNPMVKLVGWHIFSKYAVLQRNLK